MKMKMIVVENKYFPLKGYEAMTVWPFIFIRKGCDIDEKDLRHERIHGRQQLEMLILPFFLWYGIEWLIRLILYRNRDDAYYNISFEQDAYMHQYNIGYPKNYRWYEWVKYVFKRGFKRE